MDGKKIYVFSAFTDGCRDEKFFCDNEANVYLGKLGQLCFDYLFQ
jgi:hypothetical protein